MNYYINLYSYPNNFNDLNNNNELKIYLFENNEIKLILIIESNDYKKIKINLNFNYY